MRKVMDAVDLTTDEKIYFKGHAKATYLSDGRNVEDALGEGGKQEVFWVTEGITDATKGTTYQEIKEAANNGKIVACFYNTRIYILSAIKSFEALFFAEEGDNTFILKCSSANKWGIATFTNTHSLETLENSNVKITVKGKSAEVATPQYVDDKVAQNVGGGGSPVFEAIYRETSYDQIIEAYNKGEQIICKNGTSILYPITVTDTYVYFSSRNQTVGTLLVCSKTSGWTLITKFLETTSNKTQSVNENSTTSEYPTAKAVYEAIQQNKIKLEEVESTEPTAEFPHVLYSEQQLTDSQKTQVRQNIGVEDYVNNAIASAITNELNSNF